MKKKGSFAKAARLCPKVCAQDAKRWEDWIWVFAQKQHLQVCCLLLSNGDVVDERGLFVDYHTIRTDRFTAAGSSRLRDDARPFPQPRSKRECSLLLSCSQTHGFRAGGCRPCYGRSKIGRRISMIYQLSSSPFNPNWTDRHRHLRLTAPP